MKLNTAERLLMNNPVRAYVQSRIIEWMYNAGPMAPGRRVLEIGCGRGAGVSLVTRRFQPASITAVDMDEKMIGIARRRLAGASCPRISLCGAEATALPFKDESFDAVFAFGLLHHIPDWENGIAEITRVLKKGGTYYLEEYYPASYANALTRHIMKHPEAHRFVGPDLLQALEASGLQMVRYYDVRIMGILAVLRRA